MGGQERKEIKNKEKKKTWKSENKMEEEPNV